MKKRDGLIEYKYYYVLNNLQGTLKWKIIDFCYFESDSLVSIITGDSKDYEDEFYFVCPNLEPGQYYERISRPTFINDFLNYIFVNNEIYSSYEFLANYKDSNATPNRVEKYRNFSKESYNIDLKRRVNLLLHKFYNICDFTEPNEKNDKSYGLVIRELLILICTEIESIFKNILIANNITPIAKIFTTRDYVRLLEILKLKDYFIVQHRFNNCKFNNPFVSWSSDNSSQSLEFYDAYNKIKHNSEGELEKANMLNLKNSISALVILSSSQIGDLVCDDFLLIGSPRFTIEEWYIDGKFNKNKAEITGEGWRRCDLIL